MSPADSERALALSYAVSGREAAVAIFALDDRLAEILRATREPLVGQMRLTWWREALEKLDDALPPAEPVLQALAATTLPLGVGGARLSRIVDGWEALLEQPIGDDVLERYADRGGTLFAAIGTAIGVTADPVEIAGRGWALADLSRHLESEQTANRAAELAAPLLDQALQRRWSRGGRALGAMAHLARLDLVRPDSRTGAPHRVWRVLRHRLTGR
jgi:phytoene synthase